MAVVVPAPVLDTRNGDQLAAQAIGALPPELSDKSNSNPFVALIEAVFARVDALMFQLNQWPSAVIQKLLSILGVPLLSAGPSTVQQTFVLSTPQAKDSIIPIGTQFGTLDGSLVFATSANLTIAAFTSPGGILTTTTGSTGVTGSGFSALQIGWQISPDQATWYTIATITGDTAMTLTSAVVSSVSGVAYYAGAITGVVSGQSTTTGLATRAAAGTLTSLQSQPSGVASTFNAAAAAGGTDQETVAQALARAPQAFTARDVATAASDYAYFATQILGVNSRAIALANTNQTTPQNGYVTVGLLSPAWNTVASVSAQELSNVSRDFNSRTFSGATTILTPANIQQFVTAPTMPAAVVFRQSTTDQASAQVNVAKNLNTYLNPSTYPFGRTVYVSDLDSQAEAATGIDRVYSILGTKAVGMSWQQAAHTMTFTAGSASVTANNADVLNMKVYQTFLIDATNQAAYLVIAATGTTITIDRSFGGATAVATPFFFHAADTALANAYSLPYASLSIDPTNPPASIIVVGAVAA